MTQRAQVVIVGGGPGGAGAAFHLANAGHDVLVLEKKRYPREKTCGDGLTPRSVRALLDIGMADEVAGYHKVTGLRARAHGLTLELVWPKDHPHFPDYGCVIPRKDLDMQIAERAEKAGAAIWCEAEAIAPILDGGVLAGVEVSRTAGGGSGGKPTPGSDVVGARWDFPPNGDGRDRATVHADYVIVADGSLSRFGRSLGNSRDRRYPMGLAIRGYYATDRDTDAFIESHLDIRRGDDILPGYGWVFPVGDGTVNVGVGLLSTFGEWRRVNTTDLMNAFVAQAGPLWGFTEADSCGPPKGGKLPMGLAVGPRYGANWLCIGDAGGVINPFNGEGIAYALETGRMAAEHVHEAIETGDGRVLHQYPAALDAAYGDYYRVARAFVRAIGHPTLMAALTRASFRSQPLMEWVLRVMANLMRPEDAGLHEKVYRMFEKLVEIGPEP